MNIKSFIAVCFLFITVFLWAESAENARKLFSTGKFKQELSQLRKADSMFASLHQIHKKNYVYSYYQARCKYQQALIYASKQQKSKTISSLEAAMKLVKGSITLNNKFSDSHRLYADILGLYISMKGFTIGARFGPEIAHETTIAKKLDPANARVYLTIGLTYANTPKMFGGSNTMAIKNIQKAITLDKNLYEAFAWLGVIYKRTGKFQLALQNLNKSLKINPHFLFAKYELGKLKKEMSSQKEVSNIK